MESSFWEDIGPRLKSATEEIERSSIRNLAPLKHIPEIISYLKDLKGPDLLLLVDTARRIKKHKSPDFPEIDGDFYDVLDFLPPEEKTIVLKVRGFMQNEVEPIANEYWLKGEFPMELIEKIRNLRICGLTVDETYGGQGRSNLLEGLIAQEMSRVDVSTCTFFGVHNGLALQSINVCGSEEQKREWLPKMISLEKLGAFGLTEPEVGSAISMGMRTSCRRKGDEWIINGEKKWIGNATFSDFIIIWAKDEEDHQVKGFIVDRLTEGLETEKIEDKMSLRTVQNAIIRLKDVRVPDSRKLKNANTFRDTSKVLKMTRAGVAWQAVGCARGAYENSLKYCQTRHQFGRPIGAFQMTQDLLAHMLASLTAMQTMVSRLSQLQDLGVMSDEQASLAKIFCTVSCRDITSKSRELMGGNGILLENNVARFLADAEALYSYEGTKQINSLIVGRAITGHSAFV